MEIIISSVEERHGLPQSLTENSSISTIGLQRERYSHEGPTSPALPLHSVRVCQKALQPRLPARAKEISQGKDFSETLLVTIPNVEDEATAWVTPYILGLSIRLHKIPTL